VLPGQLPVEQHLFGDELVHWHQFDRGHTEPAEVLQQLRMANPA
jgi:hypothetical protein